MYKDDKAPALESVRTISTKIIGIETTGVCELSQVVL